MANQAKLLGQCSVDLTDMHKHRHAQTQGVSESAAVTVDQIVIGLF